MATFRLSVLPSFRPGAILLGLMIFALIMHLPARMGDLYGEPDAARLVDSALLWTRAGLRTEALSQYRYYTSPAYIWLITVLLPKASGSLAPAASALNTINLIAAVVITVPLYLLFRRIAGAAGGADRDAVPHARARLLAGRSVRVPHPARRAVHGAGRLAVRPLAGRRRRAPRAGADARGLRALSDRGHPAQGGRLSQRGGAPRAAVVPAALVVAHGRAAGTGVGGAHRGAVLRRHGTPAGVARGRGLRRDVESHVPGRGGIRLHH